MVAVSILTPVYNGIEYLEECVKSVLLQTFQDWELLIGINGHGVTGGEAARIAKELSQDPRIRVIVQPPPLTGKVESLHHLLSQFFLHISFQFLLTIEMVMETLL